jgi:hypothetical protein
MPVLPFINDTTVNILSIIEHAKGAGAKYIIGSMGMTLRDRQREYYYDKLDKFFPGLKSKYQARYGNQYGISVPDSMALQLLFNKHCLRANLATSMQFFNESKPEQLALF